MQTDIALTEPGDLDAPRRADRASLIAYASDRETEELLRDVLLDAAGPGASVRRGTVESARKALAKEPTPNVLVLDVSGESDPLGELENLAQVVEPGVRVLVIGERNDLEFYRQVTRELGVVEYVYKPVNRESIARTFVPLIQGRRQDIAARTGRLIAVTGVRGGVGATGIATNLAVHLAERNRRHALLLDADLHTGAAALMLASKAQGGLRVALEAPERLDELFLERTAAKVTERLHVLAGEERLDDPLRIAPGAVRSLVETMQRRYRYIVADVPRFPSVLSAELGTLSHQRVLVMEPTLLALRDGLRFIEAPRGPNQSRRPIVVLNKVGAPGTLPLKQVLAALDVAPEVMIPWMPKQIEPAVALGEPAARKRGRFQDAIALLAREIIAIREPETRAPTGGGLLSRLRRR
jgi:pilus assembly protein CpaE